MQHDKDAVVAALHERSDNPYVSMATAPDDEHILLAEKDMIHLVRVDASGIKSLRKIKVTPVRKACFDDYRHA